MNIKIEGCKVTIHNKNGDRLELNGEFEAEFFKEYDNKQLMLGGVMKNAFAVIPDVERLHLGSNKIIAVFDRRHQAQDWAKSMWEKFYLIEEVQSDHFS